MVVIKVGKVGARAEDYILENGTGAELTEALKNAGVETAGFQLRYGGSNVEAATRLPNNGIVTLTPAIKGG